MARRRTTRDAVQPLDIVLDIADLAGTEEARRLAGAVRDHLRDGADVAPWVRAVQLARDVGALGDDAAFYLIDVFTEEAAGDLIDADALLPVVSAMMEAAEAREGLGPDESFFVGEGPEDWDALNRLWERRFDTLRAALFVRVGEAGMALLLRRDPEHYMERSRRGWRAILALTEEVEPLMP